MFLEVENIKKSYGQDENKVEVLKGINLTFSKGEFCVLLGASGSGKTTLLNIIGGIDAPDSGNIILNGEVISNMKEKQRNLYRRKHLGYVFQQYNLIPNLTVRENIEVGAYLSSNPLRIYDSFPVPYPRLKAASPVLSSCVAPQLRNDLPKRVRGLPHLFLRIHYGQAETDRFVHLRPAESERRQGRAPLLRLIRRAGRTG